MNIQEGARRMKYVGRSMLLIAFAALLLIILVGLIANYARTFNFPFVPLFILLWLWPTILGAAFLIAGWIVEGFAQQRHDATPREHAGD